MDDVWSTLNKLVSHLKHGLERVTHVHASRNGGELRLPGYAPACSECMIYIATDDGASVPLTSQLEMNAPLLPRKQVLYEQPSFPSISSSACARPIYNDVLCIEHTNQSRRSINGIPHSRRCYQPPIEVDASPLCLPSSTGFPDLRRYSNPPIDGYDFPLCLLSSMDLSLHQTCSLDPKSTQTTSRYSYNSATTNPLPMCIPLRTYSQERVKIKTHGSLSNHHKMV